MGKTLLIILIAIIAVVIFLIVLGQMSKSGQAGGLLNGKLRKCPDKPNCVCSEYKDDDRHFIEPLPISTRKKDILSILRANISALGGEIKTDNGAYIAAVFTSGLFGFVDDVEFRIDMEANQIHIRSASRVGYSDLGANRKRVERIRASLARKLLE